MRKLIRSYSTFTRAGLQDMVAYRGSFFAYFLGEVFNCFIMFYIWKAVFNSNGSDTFMDFSLIDMTIYLFLTNITTYLISTDAAESISGDIQSGDIIMRMIKPVKVDMSIMFFEFGGKSFLVTFIFLPVIFLLELYKYICTGTFSFQPLCFFLFLFSIIFSYLLNFYMNLCFGYMAFYLLHYWGIEQFKGALISLLSGSIIPLAFMPDWAQSILSYLPFSSLSYTPVMIYMGKYQDGQLVFSIVLQVFWALFFYVLSKFIWKMSERRICVQGG